MIPGSNPPRRASPGRPRPSVRFRERSVFEGVARREVGAVDLVAHSVAVLVPSLTALGSGLAFPAIVGPGFWLSTLLGFGLVFLLASTFSQFSARFRSAGTLYTFVAKGLGPLPALMVGGGLVVGYGAMIGFGLSDAAGRAAAALRAGGVEVSQSSASVAVLFVLGASACLWAMSRGIQWSSRAATLVEVVSLGMLVLVLVSWTMRYGAPAWATFSLDGASPSRVLGGAAYIVTLTLAFESAASLGLESKRPMREVPFALRSSVVLAAGLFAVANVVATSRPPGAPSVWSWRWFAPGAERSLADALVLVVLAWSLLALGLCVWSALARLIFSLAREGVLPACLGRVSGRGIPMVAALAVAPVALAPPLVVIITGGDAGSFSWELKTSGGVVICAAYALAAAALPRFLSAIDEVTPGPLIGAVAAGLGALAVAVDQLVAELRDGVFLSVGLLAISAGLGLVMRPWTGRAGSESDDRYIGMHDEALVSSVMLPPEAGNARVDV